MRKGLVLGGLTMLAALLLLRGCSLLSDRPKRDCPIRELVLDEAPFPQGARADKVYSPVYRDAPTESAGRTISLEKGFADHDVYRYQSARIAARKFEDEKETRFLPAGTWTTPDALDYRSPKTDEYYVACGMSGNIYLCEMLARYEEYYVLFFAHMARDTMWYEDFERVVSAIDERMASCLGKNALLTPRAQP